MSPIPSVVVRDLDVVYRSIIDRRRSMQVRIRERDFRRRYREIHAVKGVSFELYQGETVGVVGSNGSGKSTLLGALTGLIPIRSGSIRVRSRPTLLGVGAALRAPLSGRRNIYVGGVALGLTREQIDQQIDKIIAFTGLEEMIDLPIRGYSAGMKARLAFAIATSISPEILLIDEALAVGDRSFKRRSQERLAEIRDGAGTVMIVSHSAREIRTNTDRAMWLQDGVIRALGDPSDIVDQYEAFADASASPRRV